MLSYFAIVPKFDINLKYLDCVSNNILKQFPIYRKAHQFGCVQIIVAGDDEKATEVYSLCDGGGVIIGTLFNNKINYVYDAVKNFNNLESTSIVQSSGRRLIEGYWGRYVAFLYNSEKKKYTVLRDPSRAMPAFFFETEQLIIFFSDAEHFSKLKIANLSFNIGHIAAYIRQPLMDYNDTGFSEINKVLGGQALHISDGQINREMLWTPSQFCTMDSNWTAFSAANALRHTVENCVKAWAGKFDKIALRLSGGLDSSIVLSCISQMPERPNVIAVNYFSDGVDSDERWIAENAANAANVEIIFDENTENNIDITVIKDFMATAELGPSRYQMTRSQYEKKLALTLGIDAFFSGEGGDGIFYQGGEYCAMDYAERHGLSWGLLKRCHENAILSNQSFWRVIKEACFASFKSPAWEIESMFSKATNVLLNDELFNEVDFEERCREWFYGMEKFPLAKKQHVSYMKIADYHRWPNHPDYELPWIQPLTAQPIVELVCNIPTYLFGYRGIDRGLIREAFKDIVPRKNLIRQSKGGTEEFYVKIFQKNIDFLRESLLDGSLVKMGVLDRKKVERALNPEISAESYARVAIMNTLPAEYWVRRWRSVLY